MTKTTETVAAPSSVITDDLFASDAIIERKIKLPDGREHTLYFRELSAIEFKQHMAAERSEDKKIRDQSAARLIARSLVEPDGRRALTHERAAQLKPAVSGAIFMAIMEINGVMPPVAKPADEDQDDAAGGEGEDAAGNR